MASASSDPAEEPDHGIDYDQLGVSKKHFDKLVSKAVFSLLAADQKKSLIKRNEILTACGVKGQRQLQDCLFNVAKLTLLETFGLELTEVPDKKNVYISTNKLGSANVRMGDSQDDLARLGILFIILSLIFMNNGKVTDTVLAKFLEHLGFQSNPEVDHVYEGDLLKYINNVWVTKQHYLRKEKNPGKDNDEESVEYSWGERAEMEVNKEDVLRFVSEVYECQPSAFLEQYNKLKKETPEKS